MLFSLCEPTKAELEIVQGAGLVALQMQVLYDNHDGRIDMLGILDKPFAVQVAAVVGHQVPG